MEDHWSYTCCFDQVTIVSWTVGFTIAKPCSVLWSRKKHSKYILKTKPIKITITVARNLDTRSLSNAQTYFLAHLFSAIYHCRQCIRFEKTTRMLRVENPPSQISCGESQKYIAVHYEILRAHWAGNCHLQNQSRHTDNHSAFFWPVWRLQGDDNVYLVAQLHFASRLYVSCGDFTVSLRSHEADLTYLRPRRALMGLHPFRMRNAVDTTIGSGRRGTCIRARYGCSDADSIQPGSVPSAHLHQASCSGQTLDLISVLIVRTSRLWEATLSMLP